MNTKNFTFKEWSSLTEQRKYAGSDKWNASSGWAWCNTPYSDGSTSKFKKYTLTGQEDYIAAGSTADNKTTLDAEDDAATAANSSQHMPTQAEFQALKDQCYWVWCDGSNKKYNGTSVQGYVVFKNKGSEAGTRATGSTACNANYSLGSEVSPTTDVHIFLPAAGDGNGTDLSLGGDYGYYWSSSLYEGLPNGAWDLYFGSVNVDPQNGSDRYYGQSVRPVCE